MPFPSRAPRRPRDRAPGYLFALGTDEFAETIPTGQALSFDRNTGRTAFDTDGRVVTLAQDQFPWSAAYNAAAGLYEPVYEPFEATTNRIFPSEDFGTSWAAVGTPTRVAAAKRCGDLVLDLIGDDAAGTLEGYTRACTPSGGNGPKAVSVFVAQGSSTSSVIRVRDVTASANLALGTLTWVSGAPSVAMTGAALYLGAVRCFGGAWRLLFTTTTWTVANTVQVEVYPATTSGLAIANTGTLYVGGVQVEDGHYPRGYVKTVGGVVATSADSCTCPLDWAPQDFTVYARLARPTWLGQATSVQFLPGIMASGAATGNYFSIYYDTLARVLKADISDGTASAVQIASVTAVTDVFEVALEFSQVLSGGARVRIDIGGGFGAYATSAAVLGSAWTGTALRIGQLNPAGLQADAGIRRLIVAAGRRTLASLRGPQP